MTQHALLSASGANIWMRCPPSVRLGEGAPDTSSIYAKEGTLAHAVAELKVKRYAGGWTDLEYQDRLNDEVTTDLWREVEAEIPNLFEEIDKHTDTFLEHVRELAISMPAQPTFFVESRVCYDAWAPEGFGTADCILVAGDQLTVADFKYGRGIAVSAEENAQLMLYGLGAYDMLKTLYNLKQVKLAIIQPRSREGATYTTWDISVPDLLEFGERVKPLAKLAWEGKGDFKPGDHCRYCKARYICRARADENIKLAGFTEVKPDSLSLDELGDYLKQGEDVAKWLDDLKAYTLQQCLAGKDVPGWKAVAGRKSRSWTDQLHAFEVLQEHGVNEALLYERRPLSVAQTEKVIGKRLYQELEPDLVTTSEGRPTLVPESDKRQAINKTITAKEAFS